MVKMTFDPEVAKVVGTNEAIIYSNIQYWVHKNRANKKHFYHGGYWTYNSSKAFTEIFTWLSSSQIRRCLKKLEEKGFILIGNFNINKFDRSMWYTCEMDLTDIELPFNEIVKSEVTKSLNATYNKPDIKPNNKLQISKSKFCVPSIEEIVNDFIEKKSTKIEGEKFFHFYESVNWMVGKKKMVKWKASASGWIARNKKGKKNSPAAEISLSENQYGKNESW